MAEFEEGTHSLALPRQFGEYTLLEKMGEGTEGVVYKATNNQDQTICLKVYKHLLEQGSELVMDFAPKFNELEEQLRKIGSEHVVKVYKTTVIDGFPTIDMEMLEGQTLESLLDSEQMPAWQQVFSALADIFEGFTDIQAAGLYTDDINSRSNIVVTDNGRCKIIDLLVWEDQHSIEQELGETIRDLGIALQELYTDSAPPTFTTVTERMFQLGRPDGYQSVEEVIDGLREAAATGKRDSGGTIAMSSAPPTITTRVDSARRAPNL